jgi:1,2-phenylacetyl-CoA epoxidase catalytic subunit
VRWGLRKKNNAELREQYIADTRPMLDKLGLSIPDDHTNRRYL